MIKIPYEELLVKINEKTGISISELEERVDKKLKQLVGLISKEGAAHIIANELGVKLFENVNGRLQIKNIMTGMKDVEAVGRVLRVYDVREFSGARSGKVGSLQIGDETGTIRAVLWGAQADNIANIKEGSIVKILGAYVKDNNGRIELHLNDRSQVQINPKNETVAELKVQGRRKEIKDLNESDNEVELLGTIVQIFDLKFFEVCPRCGKRSKQGNDLYICADHGNVFPSYSYVLNAVLDDGSDTVRCVFFRNQVENLLNKSNEHIMKFKNEPAEFEQVKNELLGTIVKINGRSNKNSLFNRLEFIVQSVDAKPSSEEEIKRLSA